MSKSDTAKKLNIAERREKVAQLVVSGASYRKIAESLTNQGFKCTKSTVENDVKAIFTEIDTKTIESITEFRGINAKRLNSLILANWNEALRGNLKAGEFVRKCIDDLNELYNAKIPKTLKHEHDFNPKNLSDEELHAIANSKG